LTRLGTKERGVFLPVIAPDEFEVVFKDSELGWRYSVLVPLAISDDERRLVGVLTSLYPFEEQGVQMHEFQFAISVADLETEEAFETYQRDIAKGFIPDEVRPLVIEIVCSTIPTLVEHVQPMSIYRVTNATRPPEKALRKHEMVTKRFQDCGFEITQRGADRAGREFWVMER
jgi:hypothetical protein